MDLVIKIEEYVPIKTPHISDKIKPPITSPPNTKSAINAIKVVTDVIIVLDNVSFIDLFKILSKFISSTFFDIFSNSIKNNNRVIN